MLKSQKSWDKLKATSFLLDPNRNLVEANLAAAARVTCAHLNGVLHVHVATLRVCGGHWHAARCTRQARLFCCLVSVKGNKNVSKRKFAWVMEMEVVEMEMDAKS